MRRALFLGLALLLASPAQAAPDLLDLVPANAAVVVGARGLKPFTEKLDKLITEVDPTQAGIGAIVALVANQFGLGISLDRNAPMAIVMASPQDVLGKAINPTGPQDFEKLWVVVVGYLDEQKLAKDLNIDPQKLQPDKVFAWQQPNSPTPMQVLFKDKRLYIAANEKAIHSVRAGKRLRAGLSKAHAATLAQADVLLLVSPAGWGEQWKMALQLFRQQLPKASPDVAADLFDLLAELRYLAVGVRLDGGVGINTLAVFPQDPKVAAILGRLSKGANATLAGLPVPAGSLVFALGVAGDGKETPGLLSLLSAGPAMPAQVASLWKQLKGNRVAVYQTKNPRAGQFAALTILDSDDPAAILAGVRKMVRPGKPGELKLNDPGPRSDRALVEKLIKDLGSDDFDTREKATAALTAIGRPALPYLEEALKSRDAEIARRARELAADINHGVAEKRIELLGGKLAYQVPPTLVYFPAAEKRLGLDVDVIQLKLDPRDAGLAPKLRELLGPDWDKIRIVRRDKQMIALFGSDLPLLEAALANLTKPAPGLAKWATMKAFQALADPARKLEAHYSLVRYLALTDQDADMHFKDVDKAGVTSASFSAAADRLQVDVWMPMTELRGMVFIVQQQQKRAGQPPAR